jgi:hypothetical protein
MLSRYNSSLHGLAICSSHTTAPRWAFDLPLPNGTYLSSTAFVHADNFDDHWHQPPRRPADPMPSSDQGVAYRLGNHPQIVLTERAFTPQMPNVYHKRMQRNDDHDHCVGLAELILHEMSHLITRYNTAGRVTMHGSKVRCPSYRPRTPLANTCTIVKDMPLPLLDDMPTTENKAYAGLHSPKRRLNHLLPPP